MDSIKYIKNFLGVIKIGIKKFKRALIGILLISITIVSFIFIELNTKRHEIKELDYGQTLKLSGLEVVDQFYTIKDFMGNVYIEGTLRNISDIKNEEIKVSFDLFDKNGVKVGVAETDKFTLESREKIKIRALGINPNGVIKSFKLIYQN